MSYNVLRIKEVAEGNFGGGAKHRSLLSWYEKQQRSVISVCWYEKKEQLQPANASPQCNNF
jgi:hypothetical protein